MKAKRDLAKSRQDVVKVAHVRTASFAELESRAMEHIEELPQMIASDDVARARNLLFDLMEKVEVLPNKKARLFAKSSFLFSLGKGSVHIGIERQVEL